MSKIDTDIFVGKDDVGKNLYRKKTYYTLCIEQDVLANDKDVLGVGVETVGTDAGIAPSFDPQFPNHNIMHGSGKMGLTSLCNLDLIPSNGSIIIALPLKIENGSGSPVRVIAIK